MNSADRKFKRIKWYIFKTSGGLISEDYVGSGVNVKLLELSIMMKNDQNRTKIKK